MYSYTAYGLTISSEFLVPELETINVPDDPDVTIRLGAVSETLENALDRRARFQAAPNEFLLQLKGVARFYVQNGREITIELLPGGDGHPSAVRVYLLGSVFGALLQQRGVLVLHGAAVLIGGRGVLLTGQSKAGKSTLAAALHKRGYALLTDDVCAVTLGSDQTPYAYPGFPSMKLWQDSADMLGTDVSGLEPIMENWRKYRVDVRHYHPSPVRLDVVFILNVHDSTDIRIEAVTGFDKLNALMKNTYRYRFLKGQGLQHLHFKQCAAAASHLTVFRAVRPKDEVSVDALADAVVARVPEAGDTPEQT